MRRRCFPNRFALSALPAIPAIEGGRIVKQPDQYPSDLSLGGMPLRREYLIVKGGRKRQIL